ncbi:serine acetyltransferase [Priestia aryabhattai]
MLTREHEGTIWKYQKLLRKEEYYFKKGSRIISTYYRYRKNRMGERLGITIPKGTFDSGLLIWHYGNIVVNAHSKIGKNCVLHGDNCIGNKGTGASGAPIIGDNVDIGVGAKIIGNVTIANNVVIGAGAIVNKSCLEENVVLAGVPAKIIKRL